MNINQSQLFCYRIPLSRPIAFNDKILSVRQGLVLRIDFTDGAIGYGDVAPLPGFSSETLSDCQQALSGLLRNAASKPIGELHGVMDTMPRAAAFALDCALARVPCESIIEGATVPLLSGELAAVIERYNQLQRPRLIKLKVARTSMKNEINLVHSLLVINPSLRFNFDANQRWQLDQAEEFFGSIPRSAVNYIEEPCIDLQASLELANNIGIRIALDESLHRNAFNLETDLNDGSAPFIKAFILKPTLLGSFKRTQKLIRQAKARAIECHLSSSYESSLGIAQLAFLANRWLPGQAVGIDTLNEMTAHVVCSGKDEKPLFELGDLDCVWRS